MDTVVVDTKVVDAKIDGLIKQWEKENKATLTPDRLYILKGMAESYIDGDGDAYSFYYWECADEQVHAVWEWLQPKLDR